MKDNNHLRTIPILMAILALATGTPALAQPWWTSFDDNTRYLAMGDSLSAGYEAKPVTQGFVYQLYQGGVIDSLTNLLFCNEAVPAAQSSDVLKYQIPQVPLFFEETGKSYRKVVTLTVGGNDLLSLIGADGTINQAMIPGVLQTYGNNLAGILTYLATNFPDAKVYVGNQYDPMLGLPGEALLIGALNQVAANVMALFPNAVLVDVFSAFQGKNGLLLIERKGAGFAVHPTNAGYQAMTKAFGDAIRSH